MPTSSLVVNLLHSFSEYASWCHGALAVLTAISSQPLKLQR